MVNLYRFCDFPIWKAKISKHFRARSASASISHCQEPRSFLSLQCIALPTGDPRPLGVPSARHRSHQRISIRLMQKLIVLLYFPWEPQSTGESL